jgi:hypothetical protein
MPSTDGHEEIPVAALAGGSPATRTGDDAAVMPGTWRTISPYDLHPNDNPGLIITQVVLKGDNYEEWARALRTALRSRKKFGFIDGTIPMPMEGASHLEDWWTNNSLLVSWIRNTIEPSVRTTITHMEIAKELWDDIKAQFSVVNGPRIQQLKRELTVCKQRGLSIAAYYGKLKKLWDDLNDVDPYPTCSCGSCTCDISKLLEKKRDEERVHQFLMGLDEAAYGHLRSTILSQEPFPSLARVYRLLTQEETAKASATHIPETGAFSVHTLSEKGRDNTVTCGHCKKPGHDRNSCFQLIGYPEGWGGGPRGGYGGGGRGGRSVRGRGRGGPAGRGGQQYAVHTAAAAGPAGGSPAGDSSNTDSNLGAVGSGSPRSICVSYGR